MSLTPEEILGKRFHDAFRGYNHEEVDDHRYAIPDHTRLFSAISARYRILANLILLGRFPNQGRLEFHDVDDGFACEDYL